MKKITYFIIVIILFFQLSACTSIQPQETLSFEQRQQQLSTQNDWKMRGVLSVIAPDNHFSGSYKWEKQQKNYQLRLIAPLGGSSALLRGKPNSVTLEASDGTRMASRSPEQLLQDYFGWILPVSNLIYWVRGIPAPDLKKQITLNPDQTIAHLKQQGWNIQYQTYQRSRFGSVPRKMILTTKDIRIKLVIKQWDWLAES